MKHERKIRILEDKHNRYFLNNHISDEVEELVTKFPKLIEDEGGLLCVSSPLNFVGSLLVDHLIKKDSLEDQPTTSIRTNVSLSRFSTNTYHRITGLDKRPITFNTVLVKHIPGAKAGLVLDENYAGLIVGFQTSHYTTKERLPNGLYKTKKTLSERSPYGLLKTQMAYPSRFWNELEVEQSMEQPYLYESFSSENAELIDGAMLDLYCKEIEKTKELFPILQKYLDLNYGIEVDSQTFNRTQSFR